MKHTSVVYIYQGIIHYKIHYSYNREDLSNGCSLTHIILIRTIIIPSGVNQFLSHQRMYISESESYHKATLEFIQTHTHMR